MSTAAASTDSEIEMALRVARVEQQMDRLPAAWKRFVGSPMHMSCFGTRINTFRDNPTLQPTAAYVQNARRALQQHFAASNTPLSDAEAEDIVRQEWQTDMTRSVLEARLNRHGSRDGPLVRRSANGVLYTRAQPAPGEAFARDVIATPPSRRRR